MNPTPAEVLAWIAAAPPWFPSRHAREHGLSPDSLQAAVDQLWNRQLIEARDWVKGDNQGLGLTPDGERAAKDPVLLSRFLAGQSVESDLRERPVTPTTYDRGERARLEYFRNLPPVVTQILIIINFLIFFAGLAMAWKEGGGRLAFAKGDDSATLIKSGAVTGDSLVRGEWWRLGTSTFVHIGIVHLLLNVYCLGMIGANAEDLWGRWRYLLIYLVAGLAGSSLAMALKPVSLLAGASGATWGVMASLAVWLFLYGRHLPSDRVADFRGRLAFAVLLNGAISFWPGVSWQGHLGGALGGIVMAFALDLIRPGYRRRIIAGIILATALPMLIVGGLIFTALRSNAWRPLLVRESYLQQFRYLDSLRDELAAVNPTAAQNLHQSLTKTQKNPLHSFRVQEEAEQMRTKSAALRDRVNSLPKPRRFVSDLPEKTLAYAATVDEFAQQILDYLAGTRDDLTSLNEVIKTLEERWAALHTNRWMR